MPMLTVILILAAIYGLLTHVALPNVEKKWRESSRFATVSRAGTVAAIKTAQAFAKLALMVLVGALLILGFLSLVAPLASASVLLLLHAKLGGLAAAVRDGKAFIGDATLVIALAGIAFLAWRIRTRGLRSLLVEERDRQLVELHTKRATGQLEELAPTPDMEQLLKRFAELDFVAHNNPTAEGYTPERVQAAIAAEQAGVAAKYVDMDIERRVDLTAIPLAEPQPRGWLGKLRLMLFSRGTAEGMGWLSKNLGRAATAITCLLMIGVSAPALAKYGIQPTIARITDLQVSRNEKDALDSLRGIAREASQAEGTAAETPEERQAYDLAAQHFVNAIARSQAWVDSSARLLPDRAELASVNHATDIVEEAAVRQKILEVYAEQLRARFPADAARPIVSNLGGVPEGSRRRYADVLGDGRPAAARPAYAEALGHPRKWIAAEAKRTPSFKGWLINAAAAFREPATTWDVTSSVLGEALSPAMAEALPDPKGANLFSKQGPGGVRSGLSSAAQRLIRLSMNDFLKAHANGASYSAAIGRVEAGAGARWPFRHDEAVLIRDMAERVAADREKIRLAMNESAPGLVVNPSAGERKAARDAAQAIVQRASKQEMPDIIRRVEGTLGDFEYHFPAQAETAAQAIKDSRLAELAENASLDFPPLDLENRRSNARASRSFRAMRISFRAGGVVIGTDPSRVEPLDFERLEWAREGSKLRLAIIDGASNRIDLGAFGGSVIQQALAYVADGRSMTVTMTDSPLTPKLLRVHLHPAIVDTRLGCQLIELDRFTDAATGGGTWAERDNLEGAVQAQLDTYLDVAENGQGARLRRIAARGINPLSFVQLAFANLKDVNDVNQSVFAAYPDRFDIGLAGKIKQCAAQPASFGTCVRGYSYNSLSYRQPRESQVWSGVRERDFALRQKSFSSTMSAAGAHPPLRFMLQVAFKDDKSEQSMCESGDCSPVVDHAWEFPMIRDELDRRVHRYAAGNARESAILAEASEFTVLQRLFRAALAGRLGPRFERAGLVGLMRDAAASEPIGYWPTPQWHSARIVAERVVAQVRRDPEGYVPATFDTLAEAQASVSYLDALLRPEARTRFADDAKCR